MNIKYLVSTFLVASSIYASASAIEFTTGGGRGHMFVTNNSNRVAFGSLVRVGYVTTPGDLSTFAEFATTTISHPGSGAAVQVGGFLTIPAANNVVAPAAKGKQIYLWVYNAASAAGASESAVFTSTDPSWVIPAGFTGDVTETSQMLLSLGAGAVTALQDPVRVGNPNAVAPSFTRGQIVLAGTGADGAIYKLGAIIPEPGTAGLVLLSLVGLVRRRR